MAAAIRASGALPTDERETWNAAVTELKTRIERRATFVRQHIARPPQPLAMGANGELVLTGWQLNRGTRGGVTGKISQPDGAPVMDVGVTGGRWASGSWRKSVLLGPGRYEFSGEARAIGLAAAATRQTNGVVLRLSGDLEVPGVTNATDWVTLRRQFVVAGESEEELVCEFRGPAGTGEFRLSSLKLRRLDGDPAAARREDPR
jgi:hypothetical protein